MTAGRWSIGCLCWQKVLTEAKRFAAAAHCWMCCCCWLGLPAVPDWLCLTAMCGHRLLLVATVDGRVGTINGPTTPSQPTADASQQLQFTKHCKALASLIDISSLLQLVLYYPPLFVTLLSEPWLTRNVYSKMWTWSPRRDATSAIRRSNHVSL